MEPVSKSFDPDVFPTGEDMHLAHWTDDKADLTLSTVDKLTKDDSRVSGADGFFIFCASASGFQSGYPSITCEWEIGRLGPADSNGDDQIALIFAAAASIDNLVPFMTFLVFLAKMEQELVTTLRTAVPPATCHCPRLHPARGSNPSGLSMPAQIRLISLHDSFVLLPVHFLRMVLAPSLKTFKAPKMRRPLMKSM
jgi:hypothetical protein